MNCNTCNRNDKRRKFAWNCYFKMQNDYNLIVRQLMQTNSLDDNIKRLIKNMLFNQPELSRDCCTCRDILNETDSRIVLNKCGHILHFGPCIDNLRSRTCPFCRAPLELNDL